MQTKTNALARTEHLGPSIVGVTWTTAPPRAPRGFTLVVFGIGRRFFCVFWRSRGAVS